MIHRTSAYLAILSPILGVPARAAAAPDPPPQATWQSSWIWRPTTEGYDAYNRWMLARRTFDVRGTARCAVLRVSADTRYQLFVNGAFACDGPVKAFPEHYRYDQVDISRFLLPGANAIAVRVHHWGRDTAQSIAVRPGLLVQLEWEDESGHHVVGTDESWSTCDDLAHDPRSPVVSAHLGFEEQYDARRERPGWMLAGHDTSGWEAAAVIASAADGPWADLSHSGIAQLAKDPVLPSSVLGARHVRPPRIASAINVGRCQGIDRKAEGRNPHRFVLAGILHSECDQDATAHRPSAGFEFGRIRIGDTQLDVAKDLLQPEHAIVRLRKGDNPIVVTLDGASEIEEFQFVLDAGDGVTLRSAFGEGPWALAGPFQPTDPTWKKLRAANTLSDLEPHRDRFRALEPREIIGTDVHALTCFRRELGPAELVGPSNLVTGNEEDTIIPAGTEDVELVLDLGREYNAHITLQVCAPEGVAIDGNIFERFHDGAPQWSWRNRSSFRYITRAGWQEYQTMRHFGGRYLALTVRARPTEVRIRRVGALSTHYPVADRGAFACSDALLENVWRVSRQTMLCCMEDTFVDCPLYEQSFWLGDARNEALVCYMMFGDSRLVRRCAELGGESLARGDLPHMRVPTRWPRVIPAWSFLWLRMCWENFWYSGDRDALISRSYPDARRMLDTCLEKYMDPATGLFSITAWQFFDWIGLDNGHRIVTHNNTFLVDSLRLGARMADVAGDPPTADRYRAAADRLVARINDHLWDDARGAYVDSIHNDGKRSTNVSRQINTLALLHGIVPPDREKRVLPIVLGESSRDVIQFGSPFATLYLLEYLGETGRVAPMLDVIRELWGGMMDAQTTTFWESFANGNLGGGRYPTRSYCHAWSAGPAYVFSRYLLGARIDEPGGSRVTIAPRADCLPRAEGTIPLPNGEIRVAWNPRPDGSVRLSTTPSRAINVTFRAPPGWRILDQEKTALELPPDKPTTLILLRQN